MRSKHKYDFQFTNSRLYDIVAAEERYKTYRRFTSQQDFLDRNGMEYYNSIKELLEVHLQLVEDQRQKRKPDFEVIEMHSKRANQLKGFLQEMEADLYDWQPELPKEKEDWHSTKGKSHEDPHSEFQSLSEATTYVLSLKIPFHKKVKRLKPIYEELRNYLPKKPNLDYKKAKASAKAAQKRKGTPVDWSSVDVTL